uniref:Intraflagellar transport protein 140-like protein n=1 Tax=Schistosoma haematobium TaxID=6185 RepID=A0A094ZRL2_SCHHA
MSVFLSEKLGIFSGKITDIKWHPRTFILAVASHIGKESGEVTISALKVPNCKDATITRPCIPTCISWHPYEPVLLVGWNNGCTTVCYYSEHNALDMDYKLEGSVMSLVWTFDGYSVFATDNKGSVYVFRWHKNVDIGAKPISILKVNTNISCALMLSTRNPDELSSCITLAPLYSSSRSAGRIMYIKYDKSKENEIAVSQANNLACCEGCILNMISHKSTNILLAVTEKGLLYHYHIKLNSEISIKEVTKMKLALAMCNQPSVTWAGGTTLAMALGETNVRLWDVERADNYTLAPCMLISKSSTSELKDSSLCSLCTILCLKSKLFLEFTKGILAASFNNGMVGFWQYCTEMESLKYLSNVQRSNLTSNQNPCDYISSYELFSSTNTLAEKTPETSWHPQPSTQTKSSVYILQRQSPQMHFYGYGCAVVQTGSRSLAVLTTIYNKRVNKTNTSASKNISIINNTTENIKGKMNMIEDENYENCRGSFITKPKQLEICKDINQNFTGFISQDNCSLCEYEAQVEDQIKAVYCTQEHVTYWNGHHIFVYKQSTKGCIIHLKIEGSITMTAQCGNYMACLTDQNKIRVFDLSRREIKSTNITKSLTKLIICKLLNYMSQNTSTYNHSITSLQETITLLHNSDNLFINELNISWISINNSGNSIAFTIEILYNGELCKLLWLNSMDSLTKMQLDKVNDKVMERTINGIMNKEENLLKKWFPDPNIYIYHIDEDKLKCFNFFETLTNSIHDIPRTINNPESDNHSVNLNLIRLNSTNLIERRWPKHHYWDQYESRMLVVEAAPISPDHPILKSKLNVLEKLNNEHSGINYRIDNDTDQCTTVDNRSSSKRKSKVSTSIVSLFISPDRNDTIIQGSFLMSFHHSALIGVEVPFIYFSVRCDLNHLILDGQYRNRFEKITSNRPIINKIDCTSTITSNHNNGLDLNTSLHREDEELNDNDDINSHSRRKSMNSEVNDGDESTTQNRVHYIVRCVMQNFIGLEDDDEKTREAMLNFSYYLALGEMDSAFRAMKLIKSPVVWQNMAKMCVTTCRLDVARVCLGKIYNPMGSKMLREFKSKEPELEAQAGELALQIGMTEEAEQLFIQCNRWDLVIRLHQSLGNWNKALITAEQHNRMLLRSIHYAYAKELESVGNIQQAIEHYIKSGTYQFEVPRMLQNNPELLESFVNKQNDQNIKSWWAKTLEAQGCLEEAKTYYSNSKDYLSLVRVLCCLGEESEAEIICNETDDPGACHHLGNHLKLKGCIDQAIRLLTRAKAYSSAIRLCKEHNRNDHLFSLAQLGRSDDILESAKHLENYPDYIDKAVLLYHKAGKINRAIELAINNHQFDALQTIISSLNDEQLDSVMLKECSEFFIQNNQFDRAVEILAAGKQYLEAIQLCNEYDIPITEDLIEKLTPITNHLSNHDLSNIFIKLGELCLINEYYYLACKKFTQAGNYISAIKSLIKSGDIEKIIFFTKISKQKEIYIITANYLQTINNWHKNINIIRNIIQFYIRGQAMESLITFYETCAHSEIEESGNYEKALDALTEAYKVLVKLSSSTINDDNNQTNECHLKKRLTQIKKKTILCNEFIEIQKLFSTNPIDAMQRCYTLLENIGQDDILRPGDIYSLIIRGLVMEEKYKAALTCLNEMKERIGDNIIFRYLDHEILEKIYKTLNLTSIEYDKHTSDKITIENDALDTPTYEGNAIDGNVSDETNDC